MIVVADATTIKRSLILVSQVLALGKPTLVILTMVDELAARGGHVDRDRLQASLGVPVVGVVGTKKTGIPQIREMLPHADECPHQCCRRRRIRRNARLGVNRSWNPCCTSALNLTGAARSWTGFCCTRCWTCSRSSQQCSSSSR
ncbi:MAG: hypothetical protein KDC39_15435 [Actinobacteria bacterium]|nr:hypothetical protein [Actinomycetota bacterium]